MAGPPAGPAAGHRLWRIAGAILIAIPADVLVFWLRGRLPQDRSAPQKLDTFDVRPPQVSQRHSPAAGINVPIQD